MSQSKKKRDQYKARLLAKIESKKHYPTAARRRNVEGRIGVSFKIGCGGKLSNLKIDKGHVLLSKATKKAVNAAKPLPPPPKGECPQVIRFSMAFQIK
ncbi:TonB family protein [Solemya velum gill symbiont]|uniref:TonB family protein n=1 Tax=Solemya velum gill symbiont TaxID=2340 RepID=UPI0009985C34